MSYDDGFDWSGGRREEMRQSQDPHRGFGAMPRSPAEALEPARAPEPPRRRAKRKSHPILATMNFLLTFVVILAIGVGALAYFVRTQFDKTGPLQYSKVVAIPQGTGVRAIADLLERETIISDRLLFVATVVVYFRAQDKLQAGEFAFEKGASMRKVIDTLTKGRPVLHAVSVPEGRTSLQIVELLRQNPTLVGDIAEVPGEGTLLPDTYKFPRGMSRSGIVDWMKAEQKKFLDSLWERRAPNLPIKSKQEALILASIVEKETGRADERRRVAGVFINRLNKKMRLQSDPTIIYGIVGGRGTLGRPILRSEINKPTPYNTYQIDGLPPTPIANPGRAAIEAVLNPETTNDIYFVADGTGGHAFATTLADHNKNVAKWRKIEREIRRRQNAQQEKKEETPTTAENVTDQEAEAQKPDVPGIVISEGPLQNTTAEASTSTGKAVPLPVRKPAAP